MNTQKLHVGIIGAGRIGKVHAESLAFRVPEARIVAIADVNSEAAQAVAARCGIAKVAASSDEILSDPSIEAVLICSSTNTHADLIVQALLALGMGIAFLGIHVRHRGQHWSRKWGWPG